MFTAHENVINSEKGTDLVLCQQHLFAHHLHGIDVIGCLLSYHLHFCKVTTSHQTPDFKVLRAGLKLPQLWYRTRICTRFRGALYEQCWIFHPLHGSPILSRSFSAPSFHNGWFSPPPPPAKALILTFKAFQRLDIHLSLLLCPDTWLTTLNYMNASSCNE